VPALAGAGDFLAGVFLVARLIGEAPAALVLLAIVGLIATFGRPGINRWTKRLREKTASG